MQRPATPRRASGPVEARRRAGRVRRLGAPGLLAVLGLAATPACDPGTGGPAPSVLLFVADTTRADAVSAYGSAPGTTPSFDALAAEGVLYTHAYAQAPWTLPSHVSLFTGQLPSQHQVGASRLRAPDSLDFLAEALRRSGYRTLGLSENALIDPALNLAQGFDRFEGSKRSDPASFERRLANLLEGTPRDRPFFLFVNVMDAHGPYAYRPDNPFLPQAAAPAMQRRAESFLVDGFCRPTLGRPEQRIAWALYLDGVARADAKLARALAVARRFVSERPLVTVATSDHGQHFGEHGLTGHQFSLREELIRVPLVVHGLPGQVGIVREPVQLSDVPRSIRSWAGLDPGRRPLLALPGAADASRVVVAEYFDAPLRKPEAGNLWVAAKLRERCPPQQRVFGAMRSLIDPPYKLIRYEKYPPQLYHLRDDPDELRNRIQRDPQISDGLSARVADRRPPLPPLDAVVGTPALDADLRARMRALGYLRSSDAVPDDG